ncbi:MAG: tripartite tricarboxylate transporter TctB family protein [Rhizobiaceae bacterium]
MKKATLRATPEIMTVAALLVAAVAALLFLDSLVAAPKLLFGRALTAITPSLFPMIVLALLSAMCLVQLWVSKSAGEDVELAIESLSASEWKRGMAFFAIMIGYALMMTPFGFLISSTIAMVLMSLLMGSRSIVQIVCVAGIGPILLYLAATRLLAVSLPELNAIELFYARLLGD